MKIKKGEFYKCTRWNGYFFKVNSIYKSPQDGFLNSEYGDALEWSIISHGGFQKLYTIQDLKDGKVAVVNDGTVQDLTKVLNKAFCNTDAYIGLFKFYFKTCDEGRGIGRSRHLVDGSDSTTIPTQSVKDFLAQLPKKEEAWEPKVGEIVEFKSFTSSSKWRVAEYLATDKRCKEPYALTYTSRTGSKLILTCPIIRQIPKKVKVTKQRVADILGIELNQLEII